jgi:hypothetical protein
VKALSLSPSTEKQNKAKKNPQKPEASHLA